MKPLIRNMLLGVSLIISVFYCQEKQVNAQVNFFVSGGYDGNYLPAERLNFVIDRFNETRGSLVDPMEAINYLGGPTVSLGVGGGNVAVIASYKRYDKMVSGSWNDGGNTHTTNLKMEANDYGVAFGAVPGIGNKFTFGMGLEITFLDAAIKAKLPGNESYQLVEEYLNLGFAPYAQFFVGITDHLYLYAKPSYTLDARFSDFYPVNEAINPSTYQLDGDISHEGKLNRVGMMIGAAFSFGGDAIGGRY